MRLHPRRARVNARRPKAWATSDRNGMIGNLKDMKWQWDYRGNMIQNTRILVHKDELDKPQRQLGNLVLPPDPLPVRYARVENYTIDEHTFREDMTGVGRKTQDGIARALMNWQTTT